jgi:hypothetical protein
MAQNVVFFAQMSGFRENGQKSQKRGRAMFLTYFTPNFKPSFGKILGAVSEINCNTWTNARTDGRTDRPDFIGPYRFSTGDQCDPRGPFFAILTRLCFFITKFKKIKINIKKGTRGGSFCHFLPFWRVFYFLTPNFEKNKIN